MRSMKLGRGLTDTVLRKFNSGLRLVPPHVLFAGVLAVDKWKTPGKAWVFAVFPREFGFGCGDSAPKSCFAERAESEPSEISRHLAELCAFTNCRIFRRSGCCFFRSFFKDS